MQNIIGLIVPKKQLGDEVELDETAMYSPVTIDNRPIGFISGITDDFIYLCIWTKDWNFMFDEDGNFVQLEINDRGTFSFGGDYDDFSRI